LESALAQLAGGGLLPPPSQQQQPGQGQWGSGGFPSLSSPPATAAAARPPRPLGGSPGTLAGLMRLLQAQGQAAVPLRAAVRPAPALLPSQQQQPLGRHLRLGGPFDASGLAAAGPRACG